MKIYFSDFFDISPDDLEHYGAFNVSLINDLPLFIDPFLLFGSKKPEYQKLHNEILDYLTFLKSKSAQGINDISQIKSWYIFSEVKQNWFGYSKVGNSGSGLGEKFGRAMSSSMHIVFDDLRKEKVTIITLSNKYTKKTYQSKKLASLFGDYPFKLNETDE